MHRDLKLENLLLDGSPAQRLKIADFGYSKVPPPLLPPDHSSCIFELAHAQYPDYCVLIESKASDY